MTFKRQITMGLTMLALSSVLCTSQCFAKTNNIFGAVQVDNSVITAPTSLPAGSQFSPFTPNTENVRLQQAMKEIESAQTEIRNNLGEIQTKYAEVDKRYQNVKYERKMVKKQLKESQNRLKSLESARKKISKNIKLQNLAN